MALFSNINFKAVQWKPTLILHALRAFCAGLVWAIVLLFAGGTAGGGPSWWSMPVMFPLAYILAFPFYLLVAKMFLAFMGDGLGQLAVGLVMLIFAVGIAVGDPLVYLLHKKRPDLVPTETFRLVNLVAVLFVLDPARA
jgi:hypothetical protein